MEVDHQYWWPNGGGYWPGRRKGQDLPPTLEVFSVAFATRGYVECADPVQEPGYRKVALYAKGPEITHAARQLQSGYWTSKLGPQVDVEHELHQLEGEHYGRVLTFFRRQG